MQKTTKPLDFPVVLGHYRLSGRKDIRLIKNPVVVPVSFSGLSWIKGL